MYQEPSEDAIKLSILNMLLRGYEQATNSTLPTKLWNLKPTGCTALRDAIVQGTTLMLDVFRSLCEIKTNQLFNFVHVILTDGDDNESKVTYHEAKNILKLIHQQLKGFKLKIVLIGIGVGRSTAKILESYAEAAGENGRYYDVESNQIEKIFSKITVELGISMRTDIIGVQTNRGNFLLQQEKIEGQFTFRLNNYAILFNLDISQSMASDGKWFSVCSSVQKMVNNLTNTDFVAGIIFESKAQLLVNQVLIREIKRKLSHALQKNPNPTQKRRQDSPRKTPIKTPIKTPPQTQKPVASTKISNPHPQTPPKKVQPKVQNTLIPLPESEGPLNFKSSLFPNDSFGWRKKEGSIETQGITVGTDNIKFKNIIKVKCLSQQSIAGKSLIKLTQSNKNQYFFSLDRKQELYGFPLHYLWFGAIVCRKLMAYFQLNKKYQSPHQQDSRNIGNCLCEGMLYKKSHIMGYWQSRYIVISQQALHSYKNGENTPSFTIESKDTKYIWTWLDFHNEQLIVKVKHGLLVQTQFGIPISNYVQKVEGNWLYAFYRLLMGNRIKNN